MHVYIFIILVMSLMMDMLVIADIILIDSFRTYADGADVDYLIRFSSSLILCLNSLDS